VAILVPTQAGLKILQDEQLDRSEGDSAQAHQARLRRHGGRTRLCRHGDEDPEQRRIEDQQERRSGPDGQQHELALDVVSDLDLFL